MRVFLFFLIFAIAQAPASAQQIRSRVVQQGVAIEFSMEAVSATGKQAARFVAGDYFTIRFSMIDIASGNPIRGVRPAAWMNLRSAAEKGDQQDCMKKAAAFINGSLLSHPTIDLNAYYVLALNHDATITVVDPLYGFGGSKLLALITLKSAGEDWALTSDK